MNFYEKIKTLASPDPLSIVYDISDDKLRNKLAKELFRYGIRTQLSVFEAEADKNELKKIELLAKKYSEGKDKVSVYEISQEIKRFGDIKFIDSNDLIF